MPMRRLYIRSICWADEMLECELPFGEKYFYLSYPGYRETLAYLLYLSADLLLNMFIVQVGKNLHDKRGNMLHLLCTKTP